MAASIPLATTAFAAPAQVVASITNDPLAPGAQGSLTLTIAPTQRTLDSLVLTPPANWQLTGTPSSSSFSIVDNTLRGTALGVQSSQSATVQFQVKTGCKSGNWDWGLVAKDSQGRTFGNDSSDLTTNVNDNCTLEITTQPTDAVKGTLITGTAFNSSTNPVTVELRNGSNELVTYFPVDVSFDLATGSATDPTFDPATKTTESGIATFDSGLSIGTANEPQFSDYKLHSISVGTYGDLPGEDSSAFDVWETVCSGASCSASLRSGKDVYKTTANAVLSASTLPSSAIAISCPGQKIIFDNVFVHESSSPDPIFVTSTITAADFRAAGTNFGQAHVEWCVGIKPGDPALNNGGTYSGVNLDSDVDFELFVGFAPSCPAQNPQLSAPCIVSQSSDGKKGSVTTGYLQGGDPPRKT